MAAEDLTKDSGTTRPRLALIVAAYNAAPTLRAAIDSVLRQRYDNWEVIVVDDGSQDETLAVAREYAAKDDRIRVLHQANAGSGAARNAAIATANADFVAYLDADDMLADNYMPAMLQLMLDFPDHDIYSSDGLYVFEDGSTRLVFDYGESTAVTLEDLIWDCRILGGGALVRSYVIRALGGFREHLYGEDYDLWLRALAAGYSHIASAEPLYIYHLCVENQKSKDPASGARSAAVALADLKIGRAHV